MDTISDRDTAVSTRDKPEVRTAPTPTVEAQSASRSGWVDLWWAMATAVAVLALVLAFIGIFTPAQNEETTAAGSAAGSASVQRFAIELGDLYVEPNVLQVEAGRPVVLTVTNASTAMDHDLKMAGTTGTQMLSPGDSEEINVGVVEDGDQAWCTIPGHKAAGMVLTFQVGDETQTAPATGEDHAMPATDETASEPASAVIDPQATPGEGWAPFDATLQPAPGGTEHELTLSASETVLEVAPGVTQELWTFDGQVPGPILRGKVGDVFTVTLRNDGKLGHSIDFHASEVAWDDEMRTIQPGESLVYQFKAEHSGIYMYHCGTAPALHHIGNGMYGALIVDPPDLAPVDHEYVFVQSELYLGPQDQPGDLTKMQQDDWDAVVFNGYFNQYAFEPIRVEPDERIRAWVLDAGPSENSSFHVVGTVFDTVYQEGAYQLQPGPDEGGSQALGLQPAQGGFVEFSLAEPGMYPIVTHKFSNVGKGALGMFQAGDVEPASGAGH
jgi:nitrite reductase (NO-forming)